VKDVHAVLDELVGRDFLRIFALLHQTAFDAVLDVGQLDAAVADRGTAEAVQQMGFFPDFRGDGIRIALQQALIAAVVGDDFNARVDFSVALDQTADSGA